MLRNVNQDREGLIIERNMMKTNARRKFFITMASDTTHGRKYWERQHRKLFNADLPWFSMPVLDGKGGTVIREKLYQCSY